MCQSAERSYWAGAGSALVLLSSSLLFAQTEAVDVTVQGEQRHPAPAETLGAEAARLGAGTQGDPVKALEALPGTARGGPAESEPIVWGSEPGDTRLHWDGIELPWLYHGSAIRSVLPAGTLSTLTLVPGAYAADHGRGLGGLALLQSRELDTESMRYGVHADLLDAGALLSVPFAPVTPDAGATQGAVLVAGRYGYVDRWLPQVTERDVGGLYTIPGYYDLYSKISVDVDGGQLSLQAMASRDTFRRNAPSSDPSARSSEAQDRGFDRLALRYVAKNEINESHALVFVGRDASRRMTQGGITGWSLATASTLYGLRAERREILASKLRLRFGIDVLGTVSDVERSGTLTLPPREGDAIVFAQRPGPDVASERYSTHVLNIGPYLEGTLRWRVLRFGPGVRWNAHLIETDRSRPRVGRMPVVGRSDAAAPLEPRLRIEVAPFPQVVWFVSAGRYHQAPAPSDLSATFGNPELGLSSATHVSLGQRVRLDPGIDVAVVAFHKWLFDLPVRNPSSTPRTAEVLLQTGEGRSYGTQFSVQQSLDSGWSAGLSWTISRSERRNDTLGRFRAFDHDQPHVVSMALGQRLDDWSFAALLRYASGSPRTPVLGRFYNTSQARYEPRFGALNSVRLPDYFELDLRADRRVLQSATTALWVYLDALNVTFHEHAEDVVYNADFTEQDYLMGLPPLVIIGVRLER